MVRVTLRRAFSVAIGLVALSACARQECELGESRCRGAVAQVCTTTATGTATNSTEWADTSCGDATLCHDDERGAFCTVRAQPDARCPDGDQVAVCDDETALTCRNGYLVRQTLCAACAVDERGEVRCPGARTSLCNVDDDCAAALECTLEGGTRPVTRTQCHARCSCESGETCAECEPVFSVAGARSICRSGWCGVWEY